MTPPAAGRLEFRLQAIGLRAEVFASFDKPVISVHADGQAGAPFDDERDVFPEITAAKPNQRVARSVSPVRGSNEFLHHRRMLARESLYLLVVVVKPRWTTVHLLFHSRIVVVKAGEIAQFAFRHLRLERMAVMKVVAARFF